MKTNNINIQKMVTDRRPVAGKYSGDRVDN